MGRRGNIRTLYKWGLFFLILTAVSSYLHQCCKKRRHFEIDKNYQHWGRVCHHISSYTFKHNGSNLLTWKLNEFYTLFYLNVQQLITFDFLFVIGSFKLWHFILFGYKLKIYIFLKKWWQIIEILSVLVTKLYFERLFF